MNKELCFQIDSEDLYLEQTLVEYMGIPIFFLCKSKQNYFISLCTDIEQLNYIVSKLTLSDVHDLLHGTIPMRDVFLKQKSYWSVISGDSISSDIVNKHHDIKLYDSYLPEKDAYFKVLTHEIESYVKQFDKEFNNLYSDGKFVSHNMSFDLDVQSLDYPSEDLIAPTEDFIELISSSACLQFNPIFSSINYGQMMNLVEDIHITLSNFEKEKWITDSCTNLAA